MEGVWGMRMRACSGMRRRACRWMRRRAGKGMGRWRAGWGMRKRGHYIYMNLFYWQSVCFSPEYDPYPVATVRTYTSIFIYAKKYSS